MKPKSRQRYKTSNRLGKSKSRSHKEKLRSKSRSRKQKLRSKSRSRKQKLRSSKSRSRKQKLRSKSRSRKQKLRSKSRSNRKPKLIVNTNEPIKKLDNEQIFNFKLIELEGCKHCQDAKNLILSKKYTLDIKKDISMEEENEIKNQVGDYPYFPKIFKWDTIKRKYEFIGGYDKLQELLKTNK